MLPTGKWVLVTLLNSEYTDPGGVTPLHRNASPGEKAPGLTVHLLCVLQGAATPVASSPSPQGSRDRMQILRRLTAQKVL